jgi:hypothetical protein
MCQQVQIHGTPVYKGGEQGSEETDRTAADKADNAAAERQQQQRQVGSLVFVTC